MIMIIIIIMIIIMIILINIIIIWMVSNRDYGDKSDSSL